MLLKALCISRCIHLQLTRTRINDLEVDRMKPPTPLLSCARITPAYNKPSSNVELGGDNLLGSLYLGFHLP